MSPGGVAVPVLAAESSFACLPLRVPVSTIPEMPLGGPSLDNAVWVHHASDRNEWHMIGSWPVAG